jgi:hypothetical protein
MPSLQASWTGEILRIKIYYNSIINGYGFDI